MKVLITEIRLYLVVAKSSEGDYNECYEGEADYIIGDDTTHDIGDLFALRGHVKIDPSKFNSIISEIQAQAEDKIKKLG
jgi:hypothetical protein